MTANRENGTIPEFAGTGLVRQASIACDQSTKVMLPAQVLELNSKREEIDNGTDE